ncbi:PKD domain-containing protein [Candidatus Woesearchaeota archaeon]|nr:PKD domain-containing protein [Candidatus Woesearchaeota archaeon]
MKKFLLALLLIAPAVFGAVDVTYFFNYSDNTSAVNLSSLVFDCLDTNCVNVQTFSGSITKGPNATDGNVIFRYPDTLSAPGGWYAEFFVTPGYRPKVGKHNWNTFGQPGVATTNESNTFTKMPNTCRATVGSLSVINNAEINQPLSVNTSASLDSTTNSAFKIVNTGVTYIPSQFLQQYWGADTQVTLEILNASRVIHTQTQNFTSANGNAIIADQNVPVRFTYVPAENGNFTARVTTSVIDTQCANSENQSAQSTFNVIEPSSQFYSTLSDLTAVPVNAQALVQINVSYSKITNHVQNNQTTTPVQTDVDYMVKFGSTTVFSVTGLTLFPNTNENISAPYNFSFNAAQNGTYNITVKARANSVLATTLPEITAESSILLAVSGIQTANVTFNILNSSGAGVDNATVIFAGQNQSTLNGVISFIVSLGTHAYTIIKEGFITTSGTVNVAGTQTESIVLGTTNTLPSINLPSNMTIPLNGQATLNLSQYSNDNEDATLAFSVSGNNNISATITNSVATLIPLFNFNGTNTLTFTATDSQGANASDSILVSVGGTTAAPIWSTLPVLNITEDVQAFRILDLANFVTDADTLASQFTFSATSLNTSLATVTVEQQTSAHYLTITSQPNANGNTALLLSVLDNQGNSANIILAVNVLATNDGPVVISAFPIFTFIEDNNFTVNLSTIFFDPDGQQLTYAVSANESGFILNVTPTINTLRITAPLDFLGNVTLMLSAIDPALLSATTNATLRIVASSDAPRFTQAVPNITTFEEQSTSLDLTPYEFDPEDGSGANNNQLTWEISLANETNPNTLLDISLATITIATNTDLLLATPKVNQSGTANMTLYLFDGTGLNATQNITVTVQNINDAPVVVNLTNQNAQAGLLFTHDINSTDSDPTNDVLNFSSNSSVFPIDNSSGLINITAPTTLGPVLLNITTCDNFGACTSANLTINVIDTIAPVLFGQLDPLNGTVYAPNASYQFSVNVSDNANMANVTLELDGLNRTNVSTNGTFFNITIFNLAAGNHTFKWHANDSAGNKNSTNTSVFTIVQAQPELVLLLNGTAANFIAPLNTNVSTLANVTNTTGRIELFRNNTLLANQSAPVNLNQSISVPGVYLITSRFTGNQNYSAGNISLNLTVVDVIAPTFGIQTITPVNGSAFGTNSTFRINVFDDYLAANVTLELDGVNATAAKISNNTYEVNTSLLSAGNHIVLWYANDTSGNTNTSNLTVYTIVPAQSSILFTIAGIAGNITVGNSTNVTIFANITNATGFVEVFDNSVLLQTGSTPLMFNQTFDVLGNHTIFVRFNGSQNYSESNKTFVIEVIDVRAPIFGNESVNSPNSSAFTGLNTSFRVNITDDTSVSNASLEINGTNVTAQRIFGDTFEANITLAAGNHSYKWFTNDSAGNKNSTNNSVYTLVKATSDLLLTLNNTAGNIDVVQDAVVQVNATLANTSGVVSIFNNGTHVATGASPLLVNITYPDAGVFTITAVFNASQNFSSANISFNVTVLDTTAPIFSSEFVTPSSPANFSPVYTFRRNVTDNVNVTFVFLEVDNQNFTAAQIFNNTFEVNITNLTVGNHSYLWHASDARNNANITSNATYTIVPGTGAVILLINGVNGNTTAQINDTVTITANVTNPAGGFVTLFINGTFAQNGTSPLLNLSNFTDSAAIPILAVYAGDENATAANVTYVLTIIPPISIVSVDPANGAQFNYSSFILSVNTSNSTTCSWSFNDVAQGAMTNNLSGSDITYSANVSGYSLGTLNLSVACNNQSSTSNTDVTYFAQNILDNSIINSSTLNNSIYTSGSAVNTSASSTNLSFTSSTNSGLSSVNGTNSTLLNVTATASAVSNSTLTNCIITNSIVKGIIATNCFFADSFVDPSNLTGTNVTGNSIIEESNVTFSSVTNSTIVNSSISNSTMFQSLITNCAFSGADVQQANITNCVITSGVIAFGNLTYNATISGPANISQLMPAAPIASFTPAITGVNPGATVTFTSTSTDANIPGPLNDSLTFNWTLSDGTNATGNTVNKTFSSLGTFTLNLTVTDSFGFSSIASGTITVSNPPAPSTGGGRGGGRGGGAGGGGGTAIVIELTSTPQLKTVSIGRPLQFSINGVKQPFALVLRRADVSGKTDWVINGVFATVQAGETGLFDLNKDSVPDVEVVSKSVDRSILSATFKLAGVSNADIPFFPTFNLQPRPEQQPAQVTIESETLVPVIVDVPEASEGIGAKLLNAWNALKEKLSTLAESVDTSSQSPVVKIGIVLAIVLSGLVLYEIYLRFE